jgi:uncharacterized protein with LGFP repeats
MKAAFGWYDQRVWVNSNRTISGPIREMYDKLGCRPGLPSSPIRTVQGGAEQYFANGGLYRNGAAGLTVWLRGSIDHEFRALDAVRGVLGVPLGAPERIAARSGSGCASCTRVSFENGRIYASNGTGAHALWGNVLTSYLGHGGAGGTLGLPTSRVRPRPAGGVRASFQHGGIVCHQGTCTVSVG